MAPLPRLHLPRRTVRLRLTALYGALFLASGVGLLAITFGLNAGSPLHASFVVMRSGHGVVKAVPGEVLQRPCALLALPCPAGPPGPRTVSPVPGPAGQRAGVIGEFQAELPTPEQVHRFLVESGIALALMTVVSIWLGWVMAGRALRPLRSMTATARQISEENLNQRLAVKGPQDEMKDLGDTIDSLLERLETAFDAQRRFVANASQRLGTDRVVADSDGAGLGLSIVRAIATAHGGTLQLRARPHGGLRVVIELAIAVVPV